MTQKSQKIHKLAKKLIDLLDKRCTELSKDGYDDSQLFMAWFRANAMMSNINKHINYEKSNGLDSEHRPEKSELHGT